MTTITTAPAFNAADLAALDLLAAAQHRPCTVERVSEDGPEWAALVPVERRTGDRGHRGSLPMVDRRQNVGEAPEGPVLSVQVTAEPGRRLVALAADGREVLAAGDDLADLVPVLAVLDLH